jgi:hypothetical protein
MWFFIEKNVNLRLNIKNIKSNFLEWTLDAIDEAFNLRQVRKLPFLKELVANKYNFDDYEKRYLNQLRETYFLGGDNWNEAELESNLWLLYCWKTMEFHGFDGQRIRN